MKMKRTVYHIAGNDYQPHNLVMLTFLVQRVSIQNFLKKAREHYLRVLNYGNYIEDYQPTYTDNVLKPLTLKGTANNMAEFANFLGVTDIDELRENMYIRQCSLRARDGDKFRNKRYNGFSCFDPATKIITFKSNAPRKIEGRQAVINGKLWRKYLSRFPR